MFSGFTWDKGPGSRNTEIFQGNQPISYWIGVMLISRPYLWTTTGWTARKQRAFNNIEQPEVVMPHPSFCSKSIVFSHGDGHYRKKSINYYSDTEDSSGFHWGYRSKKPSLRYWVVITTFPLVELNRYSTLLRWLEPPKCCCMDTSGMGRFRRCPYLCSPGIGDDL